MMSKTFFDTNVLVYCMDVRYPEKREISRRLLKTAFKNASGVMSSQVLQEFFVVATRKLGVDPLLTKDILHSLHHLDTVVVTPEIIDKAIDCAIFDQISFWDALIVAAAENARCETLFTEDLNDGQIIRGVRVENPYSHL